MRWWILAVITLTLAGCVASPEVKVASSEVGVALKELRAAEREFRNAYIEELDVIQQLILSSILSAAVNREVASLVNSGFDGDLILLSNSIKNERDAARRRVDLIINEPPPEGSDPDYEEFVSNTLVESIVDSLRRTASLFEDEEPARAQELRDRADQVENDITTIVGSAEIEALADLVRLESTKGAVRAGLKDLDDYIRFLQLIHHQVDEWVKTDVTVKGDELARLIDKHAALIGLGGGS